MRKYRGAMLFEKKNKYILYNIHSGGIGVIEKQGKGSFLENLSEEKVHQLLEDNIIFDEEFDYNSITNYMINKSKYSGTTLSITDSLTYECNLNCVYCMQQNTFKSVRRISAMDKVKLYEVLMKYYNCNSLQLYLYGGEPFFDIPYVEELLELARRKKIPIVNYAAVTNGTLIDSRVIAMLQKYNFEKIQITLDGINVAHDKRRVSKSESSTWDQIINNIFKVLEQTKVRVVINTVMDKENMDNYLTLVDKLIDIFKDYVFSEKIRIVFNLGMECHPLNKSEYTKNNILNRITYHKKYYSLLSSLVSKGVYINQIEPTPLCISKMERDILLSPDGSIYKCITGLGMERFLVSSYTQVMEGPLELFTNQAKYLENNNSNCRRCDYLGICNGGCFYDMYIEGDVFKCNKDLFDAITEDIASLLSQVIEVDSKTYRKAV